MLRPSCEIAPPDDLIWQTPEGIDVRPVYGPGDLSNTPHLGSLPGEGALHARTQGDDVRGPALDDPAICRVFDG